jgi:outer membrane protein assembly factor BamD
MPKNRHRAQALLVTIGWLVGLGGCAGREVPIDAPPDDLLSAAEAKLAKEDWFDATELLELLLRSHPGSSLAPVAKLRLGDARFGLEEFIVARGHYQDVVEDFPASAFVEEARWKIARCEYSAIHPHDRDQTETEQTLSLLEDFRADYPASRFLPEAEVAIADCRDRLARREFEAGRFYVKQHRPRSAKIQFEYVLESYPETVWAPKACFAIGEIYRQRGKAAEAERFFRRVIQDWPDTEESGRASRSLEALGLVRAEASAGDSS